MATFNIADTTQTFLANSADTTYRLAEGRTIKTTGMGISATADVAGREFVIDGIIDAKQTGLQVGGVLASVAAVDIEIGRSGFVRSEAVGVSLFGEGHSLVNDGIIKAATGVTVSGGEADIRNAGDIISSGVGVSMSAGSSLVNTGTISGAHAVFFSGATDEINSLINKGTLAATMLAVHGSDFEERVVNSGRIGGDVILYGGSDTFVFKGGSIAGYVSGGNGDDKFIVNTAKLNLREDMFGGSDTVKASVSFTLDDNFERLLLTGRKNIDATGNDGSNDLVGNAGSNAVKGGLGADQLSGGKGDDRLWGGFDADNFHFVKGTGTDTVMDFENGADMIDLANFGGISSFTDLMKHHLIVRGDDVWITSGSDTIVLKDTDKGALDMTDFVF